MVGRCARRYRAAADQDRSVLLPDVQQPFGSIATIIRGQRGRPGPARIPVITGTAPPIISAGPRLRFGGDDGAGGGRNRSTGNGARSAAERAADNGAGHGVGPVRPGAAAWPRRVEAAVRQAPAAEELRLLRAPYCLVRHRRPRRPFPAARKLRGRRNTNSHRPTTNSHSAATGIRKHMRGRPPTYDGRNGGDRNGDGHSASLPPTAPAAFWALRPAQTTTSPSSRKAMKLQA